ncbi:MAG: DUF502 domain-containing protein [Beijerinckiaceae bacterium]|nr:DUF502 domain-containing protein [Beijerinckiaceae bacterium]
MDHFWRRVLTGLLTVVPLLITLWVMSILLDQLTRLGRPLVRGIALGVRPYSEPVSDLINAPWFQSILAVVIVVFGLFLIGIATNAVIGRRLLKAFDRLMTTVPLARTIYGGTRSLIESFRTQGDTSNNNSRVVLIEFPNSEMRAVGLVTATYVTSDTAEEVAAVYVPTTPNPTSGYVELVPVSRLIWLDWTTNDAMTFVVSGGAVMPGKLPFNAVRPVSSMKDGDASRQPLRSDSAGLRPES